MWKWELFLSSGCINLWGSFARKAQTQKSWRRLEALSCYHTHVSSTGRPGFSLLSVSVVCTPQYGSPTFLSSFHRHANHHPPPCCPPPILPNPPSLAATSVRRWAPLWRKYTSDPFPSRASFVTRFHNSLCIAPCFSSTNVTLLVLVYVEVLNKLTNHHHQFCEWKYTTVLGPKCESVFGFFCFVFESFS